MRANSTSWAGTSHYILSTSDIFYYTHSIDPTMICAINEISRVKYKPTTNTIEKARMLIDYD